MELRNKDMPAKEAKEAMKPKLLIPTNLIIIGRLTFGSILASVAGAFNAVARI